ncbi:hypothetical protein HOLleu_31952 [Holothuria leucospilota]|uniref:Uncharacterized protein n=1 Tax=Holothuria leucospilota TaxID=206669 RepID=A0A9Q0YSB2_HOLLE|nr:hypothetical protein HOLleu_31952 [Holothuria leucospilota]
MRTLFGQVDVRRPVRNTGLNPSTSEWKVPETSNFNAAFLELSRRENCLGGLTTLLHCLLPCIQGTFS